MFVIYNAAGTIIFKVRNITGGDINAISVYKVLTSNGASDFTPQVGDDRKVIL